MTPDLSVIILTYNQQGSITRCLDSVAASVRRAAEAGVFAEIIVSDDASSDNTVQAVRTFGNTNPDISLRIMAHNVNQGVVANYFDTFRQCRGRYISDCAGDDSWTDAMDLAARVAIMDADPAIDIVYSSYQTLDDNGTLKCYPDACQSDSRELLESLIAHDTPMAVHLSAATYRASVISHLLDSDPDAVCDSGYGCEDMPILCALLSHGRAVPVPGTSLTYTVSSGSVSRPSDPAKASQYIARTVMLTDRMAMRYGIYPSPSVDRYLNTRLHELRAIALAHHLSDAKRVYDSLRLQLDSHGVKSHGIDALRRLMPDAVICMRERLRRR